VLDRQKVILAFEEKRNQFHDYVLELGQQYELVQELLDEFRNLEPGDILATLAERGIDWPGALPTVELSAADGLRIPFNETWQTHEEARTWALELLENRPVIAVDGSQITPTKDFSTPVGAVQIGWFTNYHEPGGRYVKNVEFEVIGPDELAAVGGDNESGADGFPDWLVNQKRFVGECERLCRLIIEHAQLPEHQRPVCFLDGSFIISFAGHMRPHRAQAYIDAVNDLLICSEQHRVPLVAFVDTSFSHDIVSLIHAVSRSGHSTSLSDAGLLSSSLSEWGDRSPMFICAREDSLSKEGNAAFYRSVAFTYLRTVAERTPARVEMPLWVFEAGLAESVLDVVRAECVVGAGYPYAVETADATAVITLQDRQRFYALWQQFVEKEGLPLTIARKAGSKQGRR